MRILVAGKQGQLARALGEEAGLAGDWQVTCHGRPELDITDAQSAFDAVSSAAPDIVVNAAAYTAVDKAEAEPDAAFAVNRDGAKFLAQAAARANVPIIHVSTDYVFAGDGSRPYRETDPVAPLGIYGRSKLEGEQAVTGANRKHVVLRTAWVHSPWGGNFVKTMLRLGAERDELRIVNDQTGTPTYARDIAGAILSIAGQIGKEPPDSGKWGIYHLTNSGITTWYDFAVEIFDVARKRGFEPPGLTPISTAQYPTPAKRPHYSVLDNARVGAAFGVCLRDWREGVSECVNRLIDAADGNRRGDR